MGALPSRETQRRGVYSHRHGRNRRNEMVLIPLTAEFFPDEHSPLFERLYRARHHRTAKYYYRAVRPASTDWDSDYYCQTIAHAYGLDLSDPDGPDKDGLFEKSFTDSIEGLYHRLIRETEYCMCESDEELRQRYMVQLQQQQQQQRKQQQQQQERRRSTRQFPSSTHEEYFGTGLSAYASGYRDALMYMQGKEQHTHRNKDGTHVTSPAAFYLRPVPCAIISRYDAQRPHAEEGVEFLGTTVKVLGMFGLFPTTIPMTVNGETIEQHMLKATMFVDKDVGDQILGNVVMLAVHMYVRQCLEARIRAPYIPMVPFILRAPISNIPILQFIREMRARLQSLLDAGTPRSGARPVRGGSSGSGGGKGGSSAVGGSGAASTTDCADIGDTFVGKSDADAFLFEEDIPSATSPRQLFAEPSEMKWLRNHASQNTNPEGTLPILMMSGVNVQPTPLKHPSMTNMSHVRLPAWVTEASNEGSLLPKTATSQQQKQSKLAFLFACRRSRFRIWVEDGRLCVWASAAYARRGCLLLAQQLTLTVDSKAFPLPRFWNYRGLLRGGMTVPEPMLQNDVFVVAHDMPSVGLYQGDILRCSTPHEMAERQQQQQQQQQLLLSQIKHSGGMNSAAATPPSSEAASTRRGFSNYGVLPAKEPPSPSEQSSQKVNYTSNHASNIFLQDPKEAPTGAFWVHVSFDRENSGLSKSEKRRRGSAPEAQQYDFLSYRQTNVEEVLLSWIKKLYIQARDVLETDEHWVRDPITRALVHVDRYAICRVEHDGMRYFIGITPRFVGQQRRLERVLVELRAMQGVDSSYAYGDGNNDAEENSEADEGSAPEQASMMHGGDASVALLAEEEEEEEETTIHASEAVPSTTQEGVAPCEECNDMNVRPK
ncbi:hypothetical protein TcYC6_0106480 [Trypanosoma cruzi]|nr:hypothetical protein TcYC6_0106480 [Trypanosoma cruzi]RNC58117.1 hypothetical protein TcCL_ESM04243 [Trypanosoma cruzi]